MEATTAELGIDGRLLPRAAYLFGLDGVEGPERRVFMDSDVQRRRFMDAMAELVVESSFPGPNIEDIAQRAGILRDSFARHFRTPEQCFRAALVQAEDDLRDHLRELLWSAVGFRGRLVAAVDGVFDFACEKPLAVKLVVAESFTEAAAGLSGFGEEFAASACWLAAQVGVVGPGEPRSVQQEVNVEVLEGLLASRQAGVEARLGPSLAREIGYFLVSAFAGSGGLGRWFEEGEIEAEVCDVVSW